MICIRLDKQLDFNNILPHIEKLFIDKSKNHDKSDMYLYIDIKEASYTVDDSIIKLNYNDTEMSK